MDLQNTVYTKRTDLFNQVADLLGDQHPVVFREVIKGAAIGSQSKVRNVMLRCRVLNKVTRESCARLKPEFPERLPSVVYGHERKGVLYAHSLSLSLILSHVSGVL